MYLFIDISELHTIHLALFTEESRIDETYEQEPKDALAAIATCLQKNHMEPSRIKGIAVVTGKGTFTSTRIATIIANTFSFTQQIPIVSIDANQKNDTPKLCQDLAAKQAGTYIAAAYSGAPRIGTPSSSIAS